MKKTSIFSIDKYFFSIFLKDQKLFLKGTKKKFSSEIWGHFAFTFCRYLKSEYEGIYLLQVLPAKSICWCHLILMKKMPFDYDWFCPLKMMAFMIIKGNIICWHFLKAFTFCRYFPLYSEGNNSILLRWSLSPYNLRAFHTTV